MNRKLYEKLTELKDSGSYPLHMPGHKRNLEKMRYNESGFGSLICGAYDLDITEIDGFDNLHDARDLILDSEKRAAKLYKSQETHYIVNGSTSGILAAISSVCKKGEKIIVARNCHISVYNAILLNELNPVYIYPELINISDGKMEIEKRSYCEIAGSISIKTVEEAILSNPDAKAIVITSPTYDGIISDVSAISSLALEYDIPLIVDEAHGALLYIEGRSAVDNKADIVINSLHKTLPALTQTALLHLNGKIVNRERVKKYLRIFQTSSPSYVLMGSIDFAIDIMERDGKSLYRNFCFRNYQLKEKLQKLRRLEYISKDKLISLGAYDFDESKVLISTAKTALKGKDLYDILRTKYKFQPEMAAGEYVLLMTTVFDDDEAISKLADALFEIDQNIELEKYSELSINSSISLECQKVIQYFKDNIDNKSQITIFAYPPGIPIIVNGEQITKEIVLEIKKTINNNLDVKCID